MMDSAMRAGRGRGCGSRVTSLKRLRPLRISNSYLPSAAAAQSQIARAQALVAPLTSTRLTSYLLQNLSMHPLVMLARSAGTQLSSRLRPFIVRYSQSAPLPTSSSAPTTSTAPFRADVRLLAITAKTIMSPIRATRRRHEYIRMRISGATTPFCLGCARGWTQVTFLFALNRGVSSPGYLPLECSGHVFLAARSILEKRADFVSKIFYVGANFVNLTNHVAHPANVITNTSHSAPARRRLGRTFSARRHDSDVRPALPVDMRELSRGQV